MLNRRRSASKNQELVPGDRIEVEWESRKPPSPRMALQPVFEDEWLLVIDKPSGLAVHPGAGSEGETVLDIFRHDYPQIDKMAEKERPGIVHRLDKDTSGVLILAKSEEAMLKMQELFQEREMQKTYLALVKGRMRFRNGTIDLPLARSSRTAPDSKSPGTTRAGSGEAGHRFFGHPRIRRIHLVRLMPHTGRTHQLRVHLAYFGNPVLGDRLYGKESGKKFFRLALHACSLSFAHPGSGNWTRVRSPLPEPLRRFMAEQFSPTRLDRS